MEFGSSAHVLQGIEIIDGKPVLYDMGNILFDNHAEGEMARGGLFVLSLDATGVRGVIMHPLTWATVKPIWPWVTAGTNPPSFPRLVI